jgi:hypothetical protein
MPKTTFPALAALLLIAVGCSAPTVASSNEASAKAPAANGDAKKTLPPTAIRVLRRRTTAVPSPSSRSIFSKNVRNGTFTARLLFRNLPPYWVRAMGKEQKPGTADGPQLAPLVPNLQIVEMAKQTGS